MICQFCSQPCVTEYEDYGQHHCAFCSVRFVEHERDDGTYKLTAFDRVNQDGSVMRLTINYYTGFTTLCRISPQHDTESLLTFHKVITGVTPQNFRDKIQTMLVFS